MSEAQLGKYKGESDTPASWHLLTPETHHEEDPGCWDDEATVFVGEGLVRLRLSGYGVHSLLLGVFGLELRADFVLEDEGQDSAIIHMPNVEEMMYSTCGSVNKNI